MRILLMSGTEKKNDDKQAGCNFFFFSFRQQIAEVEISRSSRLLCFVVALTYYDA